MNTIWGPALDAEIAYRTERMRHAARADRRAPRDDRPATAAAAPSPAVRGLRAARATAARRGWHLPGSGAWHAAR